jgi:hypothetical protein
MSQINRPTLCRLSELTPQCIDWVWPGYLAAGKLTLIDGDPSQGKSLLALDLAARLTTGREWPDGQNTSAPQPVILFAGEDGIQDTVQPRLRAAGADLSFIHILGTPSAPGGSGCTPRFPDDCDLVRDMLRDTRSRLLIVDPLFAFLGRGRSAGNDALIREVLTPLARIAEETRAAVLMTRHLTKRLGKHAIYHGSGSIALIGMARAAFLVANAPEDGHLRVLACTKNNLASPPPSLGYRIAATADGQPRLTWTGRFEVTADDLVSNAHYSRGDALADAVGFVEQLLRGGSCNTDEAYRQASAAGIAERTLRRAKNQLGVILEQEWVDGKRVWHWRLPAAALDLSPEEAHSRLLEDFWKAENKE